MFNCEFRIAPVFVLFNGGLLAVLAFVPYNLLVTASMVS